MHASTVHATRFQLRNSILNFVTAMQPYWLMDWKLSEKAAGQINIYIYFATRNWHSSTYYHWKWSLSVEGCWDSARWPQEWVARLKASRWWFYGAVHLTTTTLVQNFHAMGKNTNLFSSCRNAPFKSTNRSSRGIVFKCKFERVILQNQAQIGHYIQMLMYVN